MIRFEVKGSFKNTEKFLKNLNAVDILGAMSTLAQEGTSALASATPLESGLAANSWSHKVYRKGSVYTIEWSNSDVENGFPVVIMLQYGYSTGTGGYVQGRDFINPAIKPVFDKIADRVWKAVKSAA